MADRKAILFRAGSLFGSLMERSAMRSNGIPVRIGLAAAAASAVPVDEQIPLEERLARNESPLKGKSGADVMQGIGEQMSFGGVLGFAAGFSIRKVGRAMLFLVGTEVVILQYMAYREWLVMDWRRLGRDVAPRFNRSTWDGLMDILVYRMPFSAAFSGGLVAGLRLSKK